MDKRAIAIPTKKEYLKGALIRAPLLGGSVGATAAYAHPDVKRTKENIGTAAGVGALGTAAAVGAGGYLFRHPKILKKMLRNMGEDPQRFVKQGSLVRNYIDNLIENSHE